MLAAGTLVYIVKGGEYTFPWESGHDLYVTCDEHTPAIIIADYARQTGLDRSWTMYMVITQRGVLVVSELSLDETAWYNGEICGPGVVR